MPDEHDTQQMRAIQDERAHEEARRADEAPEPDEAHAHARRADKAAYLRERLREQGESERG
jgi:hypothetical protein